MSKSEEFEVRILGKSFTLKTHADHVGALKEAAVVLDERMRRIRDSAAVNSVEKIAILAGLNMTHQCLQLQHANEDVVHDLHQQMSALVQEIHEEIA